MNEDERDFKSRNVSNGDREPQMQSENPKTLTQSQETMIAALKDSEERYKALFERQIEGVYICDFEGNFLDANPAALNMLGYDKKEIRTLDFEALINPSQIPQAFETLKEIVETGSQKDLKEYKIRHKDGYYIDIETKGSLIYRDGEPYAIQGTARDISKRKKIEEQLTEQNRFLKNILESLAHPFYVINADDYTVASANSIAKQMGIIEGKEFHLLEDCGKDPSHFGGHSNLLDEVKRTKEPVIKEYLQKDAEDNKVNVEVHAYPIFNSQGEVEKVIEYILDISERKKIENMIKKSEQRYRKITELSFDGIAIHSQGKVVFVNPMGAKLIGADSPEQIMGMPVIDFIHPDYRKIAAERMKDVLEEGKPAESKEEQFIRLDGTPIDVEVLGIPITYQNRPSVQLVFRDITERKKAEKLLKLSEEKFRKFFQHQPDYCYMVSPEAKILDVNKSALEALGYEKEELIGKPLVTIYAPENHSKMKELFTKWVVSGSLHDEEMTIIAKTGERRNVLLSAESIHDEHGRLQYSVSVQRDITEHKKVEEKIKMEKEKAQRYLDITPSIILALDSNGNISLLNEKGKEILECENKEVTGTNWFDTFIPENIRDEIREVFRKLMNDKIDFVENYENEIITLKGSKRAIHWYNTHLRDQKGKIKGTISSGEDITERKVVEEALKKETLLSQTFMDAMPCFAMLLKKGSLEIVAANKVAKKAGAEVGMNCHDVFRPSNEPHNFCKAQKLWESGEPQHSIIDTSDVIWDAYWVPLDDEIFLHYAFDITDKKKAEEALRKSDIRFRSLIKQTSDSVFCYEYNPPIPIDMTLEKQVESLYNGVLVECNDVCARSYGASKAEEVIGKKLTELFGTTPGSLDEFYRTFIENGYRTMDAEGKEVLADGTNRYYLNNGYGVIENGKLLRIWGTFRDITDRKMAEEALKQSEEKFRSIIEQSSDGILLIDEEGIISEWNKSMEKLTGIPGIEAEGNPIWELQYITSVEPNDDRRPMEDFKLQMVKYFNGMENGQEQHVGEQKIITIDGETKFIQYSAFPIATEKGRMICGITRDITEHKKAEESLRKSEDRYRRISELISDFVYSIRVEPDGSQVPEWSTETLTRIIGIEYTELLKQGGWQKVIHPEDLHIVTQRAQNLAKGNSDICEYRVIAKDGAVHWVRDHGYPIWDEKEGRVVNIYGATEDITERKQAEEQLKVLSSAVEQSANSIAILDRKGIVEYVNSKFLESGQFEKEKLIGKHWGTFVSSRSSIRDSIHQIRETVLENGNAWKGEVWELLKNGDPIWKNSTLFPIKDEKGEIQHSVYISEDITEKKKAQQALLESQERLLTAQHIANLGFWEWDLKTSELYWSDEAFRIMGYEPQEFKPTYDDFLDLIYPEDKDAFVETVDKVMMGKSELEIDHRLKLVNGRVIFISSHGELLRDERGTPQRMMGTMIDITKRKMAEETVRVSEEKYRTLFNTSPEAIVLFDMDGKILDCNRAAENIAGMAKEQMVNRFFFDIGIFEEKPLPKIVEIFQGFFKTDEYKPFENHISIAGKQRWIEAYPSLLKKDNKPYALQIIVRDITERKSAEEEIKKRNEELYTLNTISSTINQTLELKEVLSEALEETISVLNVEGGLIYLAEKSKGNFSPAIYYGYSQKAIESISGFSIGEGISGQAAQLGVPLFVPNLAEDAKHISSAFLKDGWDSMVSVPLKSKDEIVGVMTVSSKEKNKFKPEDIGLLRSIGNQIGVAIENARLYGMSQAELAERRRIERKISQQNKFLKSVLESLTHPFYVVNVNSNLIEVANSAARTKGLSVGSSCQDISQRGNDVQAALGYFCPIEDLIQKKEPKILEHSFIDETGNMKYNEVHAYPIFDEKGNVDRVIEYAVDITDRKRAETDLKERDAQLRSVVTSAPIVLWSLDKNGNFTLSEGRALEALGLKPGEVVGRSVFDVYRGVPQILNDNKRALGGEEFSSYLEMDDLVWDITFSPLKDQEGNVMGSIGVATDITKRRRAENERAILFRELKHRVKNNLQLLSSMVDMQILRTDNNAVKGKLQEIQGVIETIALIYTRAYEGSHLMGLNLNNFIEEIINASMKFKADDQLLITHTITGDQIKLNTDQALPMALIANELIFNALKHAFSGRRTGRISVSLNKTNGEFTMSIADDGVGIKKEVDLKKPDSFGLKIIKNLIEQLNGRMKTLVDNGTEFIITIPVENGE